MQYSNVIKKIEYQRVGRNQKPGKTSRNQRVDVSACGYVICSQVTLTMAV